MADSTSTPEGFSLKRWSRRKLEAARHPPEAATPAVVAPAMPPAVVAAPAAAAASVPVASDAPVLPPVESLTHDSDFTAFMQPKVDEGLKRAALKKLFTDPRFNVMDGLDIYVGDYTQPDPMPEGMLEKLGKVYAAVNQPDAAEPQLPAAAAVPANASSAPLSNADASEAAAPTESAPAEVDRDSAVAAEPSTLEIASSEPAHLQNATVAIPAPAPPSGKPQ